MSANSDRNLLIGILALQMDFISREQLIAATNAWVLDKARPLDEILLEQNALQSDTHPLLVALVDKHLEMHGGDAEKSLAVVSSIGSLRVELNRMGDDEIEAGVSRVAIDRESVDPYATVTPSMGASSSDGERFRILRPHARGGLGQVSVAHDSELNREVALKEIQSQYADSTNSQARFVKEAEITGGLEHPGIVPVYGLGQYANGRPFYAMRFIRGDSLEEAVDRFHKADQPGRDPTERSLELRKLLGRFIDVCDAIEYAHSRGVLHRDLKPGNIMLGKYGETLVVDWGLAKAVGESGTGSPSDEPKLHPAYGSGSAPTQMGSAIGTPSYMSPEQAAGRLDQLGPASDVYSLGATLYCLLTGRPPLADGSVEEILRNVINGEFPRPGALKSGVPKALEAVCLKAMSLKREDRYVAVRKIAEDIEHWLADEQVSASPDLFGAKIVRWLRHHRSLAQAGAATLLVITILSVVSTVLVNNERRRADRNAEAYRQQRDISQAAQKQAEQEKKRADDNARLAGQQRDLTLETLEKLVYEVQDKLGDKPGMQQLKEEILNLAIEGLKKVARRIDLVAYEEQIAAAHREMSPEELLQYTKGSEAHRLAAIDHDLAMALRRMGDIFKATGRMKVALEQYENSHRIIKRLATADPSWSLAQQSLANSHDKLGHVQRRLGRPRQATTSYRESFRIRETMAAVDPEDRLAVYALSVAYSNLGDVRLHLADYPRAFDNYRRAMRIRRSLAEDRPNDVGLKRSVAYSYNEFGNLCLRIGLLETALDHSQRSLEIRLELAAADPDSLAVQSMVASGYTGLGNVLLAMGKTDEAYGIFLKRLELAEEFLNADPQSLSAKRDMSLACNRLGILCSRRGRVDQAREYLAREIEFAEIVAKDAPRDAQSQTLLAAAYSNFAMNEMRAGNYVEFTKWSAKAVLAEANVRAQGMVTQWSLVPDWVEAPLKVANPRRDAIRVLSDPQFADALSPEVAKDMLIFRSAVLAAKGDSAGASGSAKKIERLAHEDAGLWYDAARCYALCLDASLLSKGSDARSTVDQHEEYLNAALRCLSKAIEGGFRNTARLRTDPDLTPLRDDNEFHHLVARMDRA